MYMPIAKSGAAASCAAHAVVLQLPLEGVLSGGGLAAVLKRPPGNHPEWLVGPHNRDFFISFAEVGPSFGRSLLTYQCICYTKIIPKEEGAVVTDIHLDSSRHRVVSRALQT